MTAEPLNFSDVDDAIQGMLPVYVSHLDAEVLLVAARDEGSLKAAVLAISVLYDGEALLEHLLRSRTPLVHFVSLNGLPMMSSMEHWRRRASNQQSALPVSGREWQHHDGKRLAVAARSGLTAGSRQVHQNEEIFEVQKKTKTSKSVLLAAALQ